VGCHGLAKNSGGELRLAAVTDRVLTIFKLTSIDKVLHLDPTVEGALAAIAPAAGTP
jgi:anti-anti-sigma regulatory factor